MQKNTNLAYQANTAPRQQPVNQPSIGQVAKTAALPKRQIVKVAICMLYVVGLCILLIVAKVQLTNANHKLQDAKATYVEVQSEQTRLNTELSGLVSLKSVEERAKELGLSEVKQSQIDYVVVSHDNKVEVADEENSLGDKLTNWYYQIKEYIFG
ncbi:MAG: FtsL-like putative cell division protein [Massiliimalia sp.]|jgi:cell division protein FtsL